MGNGADAASDALLLLPLLYLTKIIFQAAKLIFINTTVHLWASKKKATSLIKMKISSYTTDLLPVYFFI